MTSKDFRSRVGSQINRMGFVDRSAATVAVVSSHEVAEPPAAAWCTPKNGDVFVHLTELGVDGKDWRWVVSPTGEDNHLTGSRLSAIVLGAVAHELAHAEISTQMFAVIDEAIANKESVLVPTLTSFEEVRVERRASSAWPYALPWLRAMYGHYLSTMTPEGHPAAIAGAYLLTVGRSLVGVVAPKEVATIDNAVRSLLTDAVVDELADIIREVSALNLRHIKPRARALELARRWNELVGVPTSDDCMMVKALGMGGEGDEGEGTSSGGEPGEGGDEDGEAAGKAGDDDTDGDTPGGGGYSEEDAVEMIASAIKEAADDMNVAWGKFDRLADPMKEFGKAQRNAAKRVLPITPEPRLRRDMVTVSKKLSELTVPAITKRAVSQELPPGRLRSREAVRRSAERSQGIMSTATPWKGTERHRANVKPIVIGIATDVSGSMGFAEDAVSEFAYVYANAGRRIGARTGAVTFGSSVEVTAHPGEALTTVPLRSASDGHEKPNEAFAVLEHMLHYTRSDASRLLLIVSDGQFVNTGQADAAVEWLTRFDRSGVRTVWVTGGRGTKWPHGLAKKLNHFTYDDSGNGYGLTFADLNKYVMGAL